MPVIHLPVLVLIYLSSKGESIVKSYGLAFVAGLFADLVFGNRLGVLAIAYLMTVFCVGLYRTKFKFNFWSLLVFLIGSQIIFYYARGLFR